MNFIKKLAKDLQISKRRHSAPVLVDEPHKYKEEQYKQALQAFTGWRAENVGGTSQSQMEKINEEEGHELLKGSSSSGEKSSPTYADIEENDGEDHSPPEGFFRTNSIPDLAKSPQKSTAIGQRKTSKRSHNKGPAPAPPIFAFNRNAQLTRNKKTSNITKSCFQPMSSEMEGEDTDRSGCYKRYHLDSLTGDEGIHNEGMIMSQKNYPPPHLVDLPDEEEEAPVFSPRNDFKKPPRKAQRADKIIKKSPKISSVKSPRSAEFNEVIDEGFQFLQDNYGNLIDTTVEGSQAGVRSNVPVTDLDKSDPPSLNEEDDIRRALSLFLVDAIDAYDERANKEKIWGQQTMDASVFDPFYTRFQDFYRTQNVIVCWPNEVTYQKGSPRSTMITPLDFGRGSFRNTRVAVRKYTIGEHQEFEYAEMASRRDFEILNYLRHPDVAVLMAVKLDRQLNQISLIMESFDFTLNYYLYKYNREFPVAETILIVQQLASAVEYLHESGYIHSNISSHAVMMRLHPVSVKLSCFELTTSANYEIKKQMDNRYGCRMFGKAPKRVPKTEPPVEREKYIKLSRQILSPKVTPKVLNPKIDNVSLKFQPYFLHFRQTFSLHYYQAPELVKTNTLYVVPRKESDVYSLTVLLWEMLNKCVPYVSYAYEELEAIHTSRMRASAKEARKKSFIGLGTTIDEERCKFFDEIFPLGLMPRPEDRQQFHLAHFISLLEELQQLVEEQKARNESRNETPAKTPQIPPEENPNLTTQQEVKEKVITKTPLKTNVRDIFDEVSLESFEQSEIGDENKGASPEVERAESCVDELLHGDFNEKVQRKNSQRTNGELSDALSFVSLGKVKGGSLKDGSERKKRSSIISQLYEEKPNDPFFNLSQSTIFASNGDFHNKLLETAKTGDRLERTSTTKKKKSRVIERAINIFGGNGEPIKSRRNLNAKLNDTEDSGKVDDLPKMEQSHKMEDSTKDESAQKSMELQKNTSMSFVERAKARLERCFLNGSKNCSSEEDLLAATERCDKPQERKTSTISLKLDNYSENGQKIESSTPEAEKSNENSQKEDSGRLFSPSKYSFSVGQCGLPNGPIARKNKLRRYAWLSEKKPALSPNGSSFNFLSDDSGAKDAIALPQTFKFSSKSDEEGENAFKAELVEEENERRGSTCNISLNNSFREGKMNINLKVKHNNQEIFSNSFTSEDDVDADISQKISQIKLDMMKDPKMRGQNGLKPKIEIKMIGHRGGESCEIQREILDLSAQIVDHFDNQQLDETQEKSSFERDSRRMMIVRPEELHSALCKQREAAREESLTRFENSLWRREKSLCEKTSYNGSLPSDVEDQENCSGIANSPRLSSGEGSTDTEDIYIDDDQLWPTVSVNINLDLI